MSIRKPQNESEKIFYEGVIFAGVLSAGIFLMSIFSNDRDRFVNILTGMIPGILILASSSIMIHLLFEMVHDFMAIKVQSGMRKFLMMVTLGTVYAVGWPLLTTAIQTDISGGLNSLGTLDVIFWKEITATVFAFTCSMIYYYRVQPAK